MATQKPTSSVLAAVCCLLVAMTSIHLGGTLAKTLFPLVGAPGVTAMRIGFGALFLLLALRPWRAFDRTAPRRPLLVYGLSIGCMNALFYLALSRIPLGIAIALEFTGPLMLAVLGSRRAQDLLWVLLAAIGVLMLMPWGPQQSSLDPVGVACALGAGGCWAIYIVYGQRVGSVHGAPAVAIGASVGALVVVPWGVMDAGASLLSASILPLGLALAVLSLAVPFTLEMFALTRLRTATFGMMMSLEPAVGALCGLLLLGERLTPLQWLAVLAVMAATAGTARSGEAPRQEPAAAG